MTDIEAMPGGSGESGGRCLRSAQMPVVAGFGIMILLLLAVAAIGVSHIRILSGQLSSIVAERNLKSELASSMKSLHDARYRAILLASYLEDPFDRDEQRMHFAAMAREFIKQRDRFLSLMLDDSELSAWTNVRKDVRIVESMSEEVFDLLQADRLDQAKHLIRQELEPHQAAMMDQWDHLVEIQRTKNAEALGEAEAASKRVRGLVLGLSGLALLVAIGVAVFVVRLSRRMEIELFQERERAVVTLRSLADAVIRFDRTRRVNYMNPAAQILLGTDEDASDTPPAAGVLHLYERESRSDLTETLLDEVLRGMAFILPPSACLLSAQGMEYEVEGRCLSIRGPQGEIIGGVLVMNDVTESRELQRKLLWHTDHDVLTGLANRYAFEERLAHVLEGKRASESSSSLMLLNLGQLKRVRDRGGHACSEEMVRQVAHLLSLRARESDYLARMGEDEFGILLQACPDGMAEQIAEQVRDSVIGYRLSWQGEMYQVGVHIGMVHLAEISHDACLAAAYSALHEAETKGPGSVIVRHPGDPDSAAAAPRPGGGG